MLCIEQTSDKELNLAEQNTTDALKVYFCYLYRQG